MTTFGNWPLLERVTNDEFLKILPHLSLEHYFLTQVFIPKKKWINILDVNFQTLHVKCCVCSKHVRFEDIENHLMYNDHLLSFLCLNAKQFYHPFYTYGKGDMKMARGEQAPQKMRESVLREVNQQMRSFRKECIMAKQFADIVERRSQEVEDDKLIQVAMSKKIESPEEMIVKVTLPFDDIPKLFFCEVSGEWQALLGYKNLMKRSTFYCNMCSMSCCGIESLNSHLNGFTHRLRQLGILSLRYEDSSKINKNCCIHFSDIFSFSIKKDAKHLKEDKIRKKNYQISNLPKEIAKKIKALDAYVPNELTCTENKPDSNEGNSIDRDGKFELDEHLGHLGVEYVLKIMKNENDRDPRFECGLCEFVGDGNKMQRHLLYYDHKKKYLDLHYFDTVKKYESVLGHMPFRDFRDVMNEIVDKLSIEIEKHHSRSLPYTVSLTDYKVRRPDLIAEAYALLHASQNRGPSFSNVFSNDDIRNLKNTVKEIPERRKYKSIEYMIFTIAPKYQIYLNQMSHDPVIRLREYNTKMNKSRQSHNRRSITPTSDVLNDSVRRGDSRNDRSHSRIYEQRTRSRSPISGRTRSPIRKARGVFEPSKTLNQNIWDAYRREIAIAANEIESAYENYRKNPESHPLYEEEWNSFWQHRKKELEREGLNHRTYNFQPEWVHYFKQRIEVLFGEALHTSQINIRHRLEIPLDAEEDCQRSHEHLNRYSVDRHDKETGEMDGFQRQHKRRNSFEFIGSATENKRIFPEQMHPETKNYLNVEESPQTLVTKISDNHSNVVHVLRLMTALEEHLGSLGGKIMDLLSNALQLEKNFRGNSIEFEAKVLTISNCQLLETAMEKLKGILFAGLLDEQKISGFNRVIQHTANLLKYAEKMGWRQERHVPERNTFHHMDSTRGIQQKHMNRVGSGGVTTLAAEKALSDTLMDLVNTIPHQTNKQHINISKEQFVDSAKHQLSMPPVCPPPPTIKGTNISSILFSGYQEQQSSSSGLASFDTKLSLDQTNQTQKHMQNQSLHSEFGQIHRNTNNGGNNLYNNSFKNNNDTRTCINTRTNNGPKIGGSMNNNSGSATQNKNLQFLPNVSQNNAMYQGGGNRNPNWSRWNNIN